MFPQDEESLTGLFPDAGEFPPSSPPSPTFTFPPLPPSPPEETETVTESTGRTEIEVTVVRAPAAAVPLEELYAKPDKSHKQAAGAGQQGGAGAGRRAQLPLPPVTQQPSSEREILDSIALTKTKRERREGRERKSERTGELKHFLCHSSNCIQ